MLFKCTFETFKRLFLISLGKLYQAAVQAIQKAHSAFLLHLMDLGTVSMISFSYHQQSAADRSVECQPNLLAQTQLILV